MSESDYFAQFSGEEGEWDHLSPSLYNRWQAALVSAREYREQYGDPVDNLATLFDGLITARKRWQEIINEPYYRDD